MKGARNSLLGPRPPSFRRQRLPRLRLRSEPVGQVVLAPEITSKIKYDHWVDLVCSGDWWASGDGMDWEEAVTVLETAYRNIFLAFAASGEALLALNSLFFTEV